MSNGRYTRTRNRDTIVRDIGPYEAIVVNHLDPRYMGTLEVELLKYTSAGNTPERSGQLITVRYLSPFYGVTPSKGLANNDGYQYTQKSYGFWAVPPDIGTKVLVIFAEGNANYGYWIGCIQDDYMNFMVPDGRASTELTTEITPEGLKGVKLPVGEYNKKVETGERVDPTLFNKPYNKDFTNILEVQGLLLDETRGVTTTSARREIPSMVFGWSTPGPLDKRQGSPKVEVGAKDKKANVPFNRLGGSSFVMDDGDDKLVRATHAEDGPPVYVNREAGETGGDETIPHNELIRLRTRTGHQILLHNSEDLIYIGNSRGTAWIEITSDGKIDIHAQDSVSVMSDNDINFTAERDFNVEAGRNINMKATARWSDGQQYYDNKESGRIHLESVHNTRLYVGKDYKLTVKGNSDTNVSLNMMTTVKQNYNLHANQNIYERADTSMHHSTGQSIFRHAGATIHDKADSTYFLKAANINEVSEGFKKVTIADLLSEQVGGEITTTAQGSISRRSEVNIHDEAASSVNIISEGSGIFQKGPEIHLQGGSLLTGDAGEVHWNSGKTVDGAAGTAAVTASSALLTTSPTDAQPISTLPTIQLPYIIPGAERPVPYDSILTRAPQHEPWMHHENMNPQAFKKEETDREDPGILPVSDRIIAPDTFAKNMSSNRTARTVYGSGGGSDFTGATGDGLVNNPADTTYTFDPAAGEGKLVEVFARRAGLSCQVAEVFAKNFQDFLDEFEATGYQIKRLGGYSKRRTAGGSGSWSVHASGGAIDINWPDNVMGGSPNGFFSPRPANAPITDMPPNTLQIARKHGLGWGGAWRSIDDAMHFSAHKAEGGAFDFPRNGTIPPGPSNQAIDPTTGTEIAVQPEEQGNDLNEPSDIDDSNKPGPQNADGTSTPSLET
jgi:hypothetical protein